MRIRHTDLVFPLNIRGVISNCICDTKIDEFELALDEDEVSGFKIGVYDFLLMDNLHRLEHLFQYNTTILNIIIRETR